MTGWQTDPPWAIGTTPLGLKPYRTTVSMPSICSASAQTRWAVSSIVGAASRRASETVVAARSLISVVRRSEATCSRPCRTRSRTTASSTTTHVPTAIGSTSSGLDRGITSRITQPTMAAIGSQSEVARATLS